MKIITHDKEKFGKSFEYDNAYWKDPLKFGEIILYQLGEVCFESGHEVSLHEQICHEVTYVVSGKGMVTCANRVFPISPGDIILNYKGERHSISASPDSKLRFFYLGFMFNENCSDPDIIKLSHFYASRVKSSKVSTKNQIFNTFISVVDEFYENAPMSKLAVKSLLLQILIYCYREFVGETKKNTLLPTSSYATGDTTYAVIKYIEKNLLNIVSLTEISEHLGYSYNYLSHLFKRKVGISLQSYINNEKVEKSKELIRSGRLSMTEISAKLNYQTVQAFSKSFKNATGFSPSSYKKNAWREDDEKL